VPAESELVVSAAKTHIEIGEAVSITIKIPSDFAPPFDIYTSVSNGAVVLPSRDLGHTVTGSFTSSNAGKATLYVRVTDANGERVQGGITFTVGCVPDWQCSKWSECQDGEQTQTCWDANECGIDDDKPAETRKCAAYELDLYVAEDGNKVGYRQPAISMPAPRNFVLPLCIQVENSAPHVETMVYFREFIAGPGATQEAPPEFDELGCDFISKYESSQVWGEVDQAGTTTVTVTMTDAELRTAQGVVDVHTSCDIACECEKACFDSVGDALFENAEHYKRSWPEMITNRQEFYDCCDNCPLSACTRGETCHYWWQ